MKNLSRICPFLLPFFGSIFANEIEWSARDSSDGRYFQLVFEADLGVTYTIESSLDGVSWNTTAQFFGRGDEIVYDVLEYPDDGGTQQASPSVPDDFVAPLSATFTVSPVLTASGINQGTVFSWTSLENDNPIKHYSSTDSLHPSFHPIAGWSNEEYNITFIQIGPTSATEIPYSNSLAGVDAETFGVMLSALSEINQSHETGGNAGTAPPPPTPDPSSKSLFRIKRVYYDSDNDGSLDHEEIADGTNAYDWDTDGDGIGDSVDLNPLQNDALLNPHTAGLPASLSNDLEGIWDFENPLNLSDPVDFPSAIPGVGSGCRVYFGGKWAPARGVVSHGLEMMTSASGLKMDEDSLLDGEEDFSFIIWAKFPAGELTGRSENMDIFAFGGAKNGSNQISGIPNTHAYFTANDKIRVSNYRYNAQGQEIEDNGVEWARPSNLDDGKWHQIAFTRNNRSYRLYVDGAQVGNSQTGGSGLEFLPVGQYFVVGTKYLWRISPFSFFKGTIDRIRVYDNDLSANSIAALYDQDADLDGLYDRNEGQTRRWIDANSDSNYQHPEGYFEINPYRWDPPIADHDDDKVPSIEEQDLYQTVIWNPDSDGDFLPDGWEIAHGLSPLSPPGSTDATDDMEPDGVSNFLEYQYQTNPSVADSDGDSSSDFAEIYGLDGNIETPDGTNPTLTGPDDQPDADPNDLYSITIGVGDESNSKSEHYIVNVYRIDPNTELEEPTPFLIHAAPSHGTYSERTYPFFNKNHTYSFELDWQSSKDESLAADFDYTFKVAPQVSDLDIVLTDAVSNLGTELATPLTLLGDKLQNKDEIVQNAQNKRVVVKNKHSDLAIDTNMDTNIVPIFKVRSSSASDDPIEEREQSVVIDINNNNSNQDDDIDNHNEIIDGKSDQDEHTKRTGKFSDGHRFSLCQAYVKYNKYYYSRNGQPPRLQLRLKLADPQTDKIIRVFKTNEFGLDNPLAAPLIGPGNPQSVLSEDIIKKIFAFRKSTYSANPLDLFVEGLTYGHATLVLELFDALENKVIEEDRVRITVNVDRIENDTANKTELNARYLRGFAPHYVGAQETLPGNAAVRALAGTIICRPSAFKPAGAGPASQHTWMRSRTLRKNSGIDGAGENALRDIGSSFWIGLTQNMPDGTRQWVQCGLRWFQPKDLSYGTPIAAYLETADTWNNKLAKNLKQASSKGPDFFTGVRAINVAPLANWDTEPIEIHFILFKDTRDTDDPIYVEDGSEPDPDHGDSQPRKWRVVFRNAKDPAFADLESQHIHLFSGRPIQKENSVAPGSRATLSQRYNAQFFKDLQLNFETSHSISFIPGTANEKASFKNLRFATVVKPGVDDQPVASDGFDDLFDWADNSFSWISIALQANAPYSDVKTGRVNGTVPENGNFSHPWWNVQGGGDKVEWWDTRAWGFLSNQ